MFYLRFQEFNTQIESLFNIIMQTIYIVANWSMKSSLTGADVVIEPQTSSIGYFDFHRAEECISQGKTAALNLIPEIKRQLAGV